MTRIILGDLCLELAVKTNNCQKQLFVYKTLFTLLGHMTNFVYKSHDKNYTRRFMPWKGLQGDFWVKWWRWLQQFKFLEVRAVLLALKNSISMASRQQRDPWPWCVGQKLHMMGGRKWIDLLNDKMIPTLLWLLTGYIIGLCHLLTAGRC